MAKELRDPKGCAHQDSVRFGYEIDGRPASHPIFVCRGYGATAPDPRCKDWYDIEPRGFGFENWPIGSAFLLMDYRNLAHVHPVAR